MQNTASAHGTEAAAPAHKSPPYFLIWGVLFALTIAEVLVAFVAGMPKTLLIIVLMVLALWKALLVALYYMHLKFEPRRLVLIVLSPLPLILILLGVVLAESW